MLPLRIMIVDDHKVVRDGLRSLLEASGELVVAEAGTIAEAIAEAERSRPRVILMDVRLGDESGIAATQEILARQADIKVLMLTSFPDPEAVAAAVRAGASGFLLKDVTGDDIVRSVRAVARGELAFASPEIASAIEYFDTVSQSDSPKTSGPWPECSGRLDVANALPRQQDGISQEVIMKKLELEPLVHENDPVIVHRDVPVRHTTTSKPGGLRLAFAFALAASIVFTAAGSYAIVRGFDAREQVRNELLAEGIVTPEDASIPNTIVDSAETAMSQADIIRTHALEATGGKTYAEMDREDPLRQVAFSASALRTALLSAVLAFNTAMLVIGFGAFVASIGILGIVLLVLLRGKFRTT